MKQFLPILSLLIVIMALSGQSHAAIKPQIEQQAIERMEQGLAHSAFILLQGQSKTRPQDWFLYGMAAKRAGNIAAALTGFQKVLQLDPNAQRAKLELATILVEQRHYENARRLFLDVKATNPPEQVIQNIDRYLAVIDGREGAHATTRIRSSLGVVFDSNVNNGPTVDSVLMFGLPFTLSDDTKRRSDFAYLLKAEIDHIAKLSPALSWQSIGQISWKDYFQEDAFDQLTLDFSSGPVFQILPQSVLSIPVAASVMAYTDQGNFYSVSLGVAPQFRYQFNETLALNLNGSLNHKHYIENSKRDTWSYMISPGIDVKACGEGSLRLNVNLARDVSGLGIYSNNAWAMNASIFCPIGQSTAASVYGSYGRTDYKEKEAAYSKKRKDNKLTVGANIQHAYQPLDTDIILGLSYTHNDSKLPIYDYERVQSSISLRKKF